jgi:MFS family permease
MRFALAGLAALAVAMGIGRFAFTPLLPMMQADAGLTLAQGGWLASANYAGYLAGALWAAAVPVRAEQAIKAGLLLIAATTAAMGLVDGLLAWALLRAAAGVASAWVLVYVSYWSLEKLIPLGRPSLNGVVYAGVGAGVAVAGLCCLALMRAGSGSPAAWIALGTLSFAVLLALLPVFDGSSPVARLAQGKAFWDRRAMRLVACYGAYGFGYIIPATYLPAMARDSLRDPLLFGWAWPIFGAAAAASTLAVASFAGRADNRKVWSACHFVMAVGVAAPLLLPGLAGILTAAFCVGGTFVVITMVGVQEARRVAGERAGRLIAALTAAFAAGQIVGPALVTAIVTAGAPASASLAAASVVLVASGIALLGK